MLDGKIVLVDDNEAVLKTLKMILAREFKTVVGVSVPTLLPALLREGDVDIVLLDMNFVTGRAILIVRRSLHNPVRILSDCSAVRAASFAWASRCASPVRASR